MRILFVHDVGRLIGGTEVLIQREIRGLEESGHEVRTVVGRERIESLEFGDYTFQTPGQSLPKIAMLYNPAAKRAVRRAVADFNPDIVHYHTLSKASPSVLREAKGCVRLASLHDYGVFYPLLPRVLPREEACDVGDVACCRDHAGNRYFFERVRAAIGQRGLLKLVTGVVQAARRHYFERLRTAMIRRELLKLQAAVVPSEFVANVARSLGIPNVFVIPGSIPDAPREPVAKIWDIAYVGRLEPEKGVIELVQEFSLLSALIPDVRLVIAGTGSLDAAVRDAVSGFGDRVSVVGQVTPEEAQQIMASAAISVVPSLWPEPFGLVGPESMACGTPVVASGRGGIGEWLDDGYNGLRADPTQKGAMAAAMQRLLTDDELRRHCIAGALATSSAFDVPSHTAKLEALYTRLLGWDIGRLQESEIDN
jgi:glycosyltransferase involved in cell wall biosynthesis